MLWIGGLDRRGYGKFSLGGRMGFAHRFSYELANGPASGGLVIDHLCRVPSCVAPLHLEAVAQAENVRRGAAGKAEAARTHCPLGHEYTAANTYQDPRGKRRCRACMPRWSRRARARANTLA